MPAADPRDALVKATGLQGFDVAPDGRIAYAAPHENGIALHVDGDPLTDGTRDLQDPVWLADPARILARGHGAGGGGDLVAVDPDTGATETVLGDDHMTLNVRQHPGDADRVAFASNRSGSVGLHTLDLESGDVDELVPTERWVWQYDFSPDGTRVVYQAGQYDDTAIRVADLADGATETLRDGDGDDHLPQPVRAFGTTFWHDDGVLFSATGRGYEDVGVLAPDGGVTWLDRTDVDTKPIGWDGAGDAVATVALGPGDQTLRVHRDGDTRVVAEGGVPEGCRWTPDGELAYSLARPDSAGDLWVGEECRYPVGRVDAPLVDPEPVAYEADDGATVHALLYAPEDAHDEAVVYAHGGWAGRSDPRLAWKPQGLALAGYTVLAPDFRGSDGYGSAWRDATDGDLGGRDLGDLRAGTDWLRDRGHGRVGLVGHSVGGYLAAYGLTATDAFDAGVAFAPICDLEAYVDRLTEMGVADAALSKLGGTPEERPEFYRERSPLAHADRLADPLLLVHGGDDRGMPPDASDGLLDAVPEDAVCERFVVDGEGHTIDAPASKRAFLDRVTGFLDATLRG